MNDYTYWLQRPLYFENFTPNDYFGYIDNALTYIGKITEISSRAKNYRSVLITYSLNDTGKEQNLHVGTGLGSANGFAKIYLERKLFENSVNYDLASLLDCTSVEPWNNLLSTYLHEFTHTVEPYYPAHDYHYVLNSIPPVEMENFETTKRFLLNQILSSFDKNSSPESKIESRVSNCND